MASAIKEFTNERDAHINKKKKNDKSEEWLR